MEVGFWILNICQNILVFASIVNASLRLQQKILKWVIMVIRGGCQGKYAR